MLAARAFVFVRLTFPRTFSLHFCVSYRMAIISSRLPTHKTLPSHARCGFHDVTSGAFDLCHQHSWAIKCYHIMGLAYRIPHNPASFSREVQLSPQGMWSWVRVFWTYLIPSCSLGHFIFYFFALILINDDPYKIVLRFTCSPCCSK